MTFDEILQLPQFSLSHAQKDGLLLRELDILTSHHRSHCPEYNRLLEVLHPNLAPPQRLTDIPYLPVSLFKTHALRSIEESEIFKTLTSSGTTGQQVSRIILDRETARRQTSALSRIMTHVLGQTRLPMMLIDTPSVLQNRRQFSARAAGLLGMMNFGRQHFYALDDAMQLREHETKEFIERFSGQPILIFGFTFMVWQYFLRAIENLGADLSQATLVHSGGWKKLQEMAVSNAEFRRRFAEKTGLRRIYNFYGMVEQVGSIFLEGEDGYLYPPNYADVIIRDPETWEEAPIGKPGVIQVLSLIPLSYPGHSLLTADMGVVHGIDDSTVGRKGKYFSVLGRVARAEIRGCSDTHAQEAPAA
jgi:acyl-CoA synthetase (AMP-forming)/AMP-acid ligase II